LNPPEAQLRKILELERRKGYADTAVLGGLDRYLKNLIQRDNLGPRSPITESIMLLPTHGYASLPREERQRWLTRTLQRLSGAIERPTATVPTLQEARATAARPRRLPPRPPAVAPPSASALDRPVTALKGVSTGLAAKLGRLGVTTLQDMLFFFPRRYNDFASIRPIAELIVGEEQTVIGSVWSAKDTPIGRRLRGTEALIGDETGTMRVVWFNQPYIAQQLRTNERIVLAGKVTLYKGQKTLENPEYEPLESEELLHTGRLVPVYRTTTGLAGRTVRRLAKQALDGYAGALPDLLPPELLSRNRMLPRATALRQMHFPDGWDDLRAARRRLAFDELLLIQVGVLERKREWQERGLAQPLRLPEETRRGYVESLPFALTGAQQRAMAQTLADVARERPMSRLLQGDVGSGKTVVAAAALLAATASGAQGAMMAPTEILAEQHFHTLCEVLSCSERTASIATVRPAYLSKPLTIALLTGSLPATVKRELRKQIAAADIDIVVGTHAVIQEGVNFHRLGLAIVDEQHRFGVMQRAALREKGRNPHVLVMTATPIPRTLTLTVYGDLDVSVIDEMPPGRKPVQTRWVPPDERDGAYEFVRRQAQQGYQAFIICPLIEESEALATRAVTQEFERLSSEVFPDLRLGLLHGRLAARKKESVMRDFRDRRLDILVSTAVVEVGVDIPNATVMMVEGAERFGLAQLHQLRGRVGRSNIQSCCLLLSDSPTAEARERLQIVERTQDGFALAEEDLRLRGPGEFFGTRQSGLPDLKVAQLSDVPLIELARTEASRLLESDPDLARAEHAQLREEVSRLWDRVTAEAH
jgi:ATP-dependent DNA helicase RecG